ncbi:IS66 family insertion sequence element accessory protein TnpA [Brenneria corticis]|uniref:IS66 family insertion sequence element accessory protein TnpA n=1 Tax=Brenneria corticis TaxID=2173106 RepID=UPI003AA7DA98
MTVWQASGLSGQVFCQQQQLTYHQFVYWRQKNRTPEDRISPGFAKVAATVQANSAELTLSLPNGQPMVRFEYDPSRSRSRAPFGGIHGYFANRWLCRL